MTNSKETVLRTKAADKLADLLAYRGNGAFTEMVALLDALDACYAEEMLTVKPEQLLYKQGAAAQVRVLRNALVSARNDVITDLPKV